MHKTPKHSSAHHSFEFLSDDLVNINIEGFSRFCIGDE